MRKYQEKLNLEHWRIQISEVKPQKSNLMEIAVNRDRQHASLRVGDAALTDPDKEQLILHELLHLVFDPIREEHDFQLMRLPSDRAVEYRKRLDREVEKAVEHLSHVLYNSWF